MEKSKHQSRSSRLVNFSQRRAASWSCAKFNSACPNTPARSGLSRTLSSKRPRAGLEGGATRGAILPIVAGTALLCAIAAYAILIMTLAQAKHTAFYRERTRARYAAEAGIVWAQQRLFISPTWGGGTLPIDGINVAVTVAPPCGAPPCPLQTIQAAVMY